MADTITLATLKTRCREMANMENSQFVSDTELLSYINGSYAKLYDILVSRFEDYYTVTTELTISSGNTVALPSTFYKLVGLDYKHSASDYSTVTKFNFQDRNRGLRSTRQNWRDISARQYRIVANSLHILPEDKASGTYRLWYVPALTRLASDVDTMDAVNGWEDYVIVDTAIKMLTKEEQDVSALILERQQLETRIEAMAQNRDQGPETVSDANPTAWYDHDLRWDY